MPGFPTETAAQRPWWKRHGRPSAPQLTAPQLAQHDTADPARHGSPLALRADKPAPRCANWHKPGDRVRGCSRRVSHRAEICLQARRHGTCVQSAECALSFSLRCWLPRWGRRGSRGRSQRQRFRMWVRPCNARTACLSRHRLPRPHPHLPGRLFPHLPLLLPPASARMRAIIPGRLRGGATRSLHRRARTACRRALCAKSDRAR